MLIVTEGKEVVGNQQEISEILQGKDPLELTNFSLKSRCLKGFFTCFYKGLLWEINKPQHTGMRREGGERERKKRQPRGRRFRNRALGDTKGQQGREERSEVQRDTEDVRPRQRKHLT